MTQFMNWWIILIIKMTSQFIYTNRMYTMSCTQTLFIAVYVIKHSDQWESWKSMTWSWHHPMNSLMGSFLFVAIATWEWWPRLSFLSLQIKRRQPSQFGAPMGRAVCNFVIELILLTFSIKCHVDNPAHWSPTT